MKCILPKIFMIMTRAVMYPDRTVDVGEKIYLLNFAHDCTDGVPPSENNDATYCAHVVSDPENIVRLVPMDATSPPKIE